MSFSLPIWMHCLLIIQHQSKKKIDLEYWFCVKDGCVTYELYRKVLRKINGKTVTMLRDNMGQEMPIKYFKKSLTDREKKTMVKLYKELYIEDAKFRAFKDGNIKEADPEVKRLKTISVEEYYKEILEDTHNTYSYLFEYPQTIEDTEFLLKSEQEQFPM